MTMCVSPCQLCSTASCEFNWSNVCCRARFITGLPRIDLRRGWMARWKERESAEFYDAIARAVKAAWELKTSGVEVAHG